METHRSFSRNLVLVTLFFTCFAIGCQLEEKNEYTEEEAKDLMNRYMETMNNADLALIDEMISPDFVLRTPFLPEPLVGIEGYKGLVTNTASTFSDFHATIVEVLVKGDRIWGQFTMQGVNTGPLGDIPATGKKFHIRGLAITRVVDGMIMEDQTFWDVLGFYQQLGFTLIPPGEPAKL